MPRRRAREPGGRGQVYGPRRAGGVTGRNQRQGLEVCTDKLTTYAGQFPFAGVSPNNMVKLAKCLHS
eukprot:11195982-Lingulodinium_polyedra.AAC.1